ncbi:MAG TPA: hypothetical protein VF147_12060 [Vicinamibacterales bacterium]
MDTVTAALPRRRPDGDRPALSHLTPQVRSLLVRIRAEYLEMPGLKLTEAQARRLWNLDRHTCRIALAALLKLRFLEHTVSDAYVLAAGDERARWRA